MSPDYAPPEVIEGRVSGHSDQYSLAITYAQLRTGRLPFTGDSVHQILYAHVYTRPRPDGDPRRGTSRGRPRPGEAARAALAELPCLRTWPRRGNHDARRCPQYARPPSRRWTARPRKQARRPSLAGAASGRSAWRAWHASRALPSSSGSSRTRRSVPVPGRSTSRKPPRSRSRHRRRSRSLPSWCRPT